MYGSDPVVGTKVRVGVGVVIQDSVGSVLLEKRRDCGWWGLPGGKIEAGESVVEAAVRETLEETGLAIEVTHMIGVYSNRSGRIVTYPDNGDVVHLIDVIVGARVLSGQLTCSDESETLRYFPSRQLPSDLVPPARQPIVDALEGMSGILR